MMKFICAKCGAVWFCAADVSYCDECGGELVEVEMEESDGK